MANSQLPLSGHSMYPALKDSDNLEVHFFDQPEELDSFAVGQVVLSRSGAEWVAHRVVEDKGVKRIKGDWSTDYDNESLVWGKVLSVNGKTSFAIKDTTISQFSKKILFSKTKLQRKTIRLALVTYIFFKRFLRL